MINVHKQYICFDKHMNVGLLFVEMKKLKSLYAYVYLFLYNFLVIFVYIVVFWFF